MASWLFTINDQIREREGSESVNAIVSILRAGAHAAASSDLAGIEAALRDASQRYERPLAASEIHGIAGNLSVPDLTVVHVVDGSGRPITDIAVRNDLNKVEPGQRSENTHVDPEHPDRPLYS